MRTTPTRSDFKNSAARYVFSLFILLWLTANTAGLAQNFWQQTNGPFGGGIGALLINPTTQDIFAGTNGGVFRFTNNGDSWTAVNNGLKDTYVLALAINPTTQDIFAGTLGGGVFRFTNNGDSWTPTGLTTYIPALAINESGHIFAGTSGGGVFRSVDNGNNWTSVHIGLTNTNVSALAINDSGHIFAGTLGGGVFRSADNGNNWTSVNIGLTNTNVSALAINDSGHIFAGTDGSGVFLSTTNGESWTAVNTGLTNTGVFALAINASGHIFAGAVGRGVFRSTDNGDNWTQVNSGLTNTDVGALAINASGDVFAGTAGRGVFRSADNGNNWAHVNTGLIASFVQALAINNSTGYIFAGIRGGGIFRSADKGDRWTDVNTDLTNNLTNTRIFALAINASGAIFAAIGGHGAFRSTNNGDNWTSFHSWLAYASVFSLALNARGDIFAGTDSGWVFRSTNDGVSWTPIKTRATNTDVRALAINSSGHIFAGTDGGGVLRSTDNGDTWTAINTGLANTRVFALAINASGYIFVGTIGGGVFRSTDNGGSWTAFDTALKYTGVFALAFNSSGHIFAGTNGGVYRSVASTLPAYPSTLSLNTAVSFPSLPNASNYKATDYRIVGLPGKSDLPVNQFLSGTQNKDWQVYWDNGAAGNFFVAFDGSSTFQFSTGRAFWIINKGPVNINTTVPSAPLNAAQEIELPLRAGWNLIANPFTMPIAWSKIQTANSLSDSIYAYNGSSGFRTSPNFEPYIGYYYFESRTNPPPLKIPYALYFSSTSAANVDPAIWRVNISLSSGEFSDKSTSFGIAPATSRDLDRLDFRKPRAIAAMPSVEFKRPAWDVNYSTFATDIRPEIQNSESWEFEVRAIPHQPVQLTFSGIQRIPAHFEVYLIDEGRAQSVNLREDSLYHFNPAAEVMKFKVVVGRKENVQEQLSALALPKEFTLEQNYPNPLQTSVINSSTTISVAVPLASEVELRVYDILGKEVKTLYHGALAAGRYWFSWDGRNTAGSNVVTGVYLYRLSTNTGVSLLGKMILIR